MPPYEYPIPAIAYFLTWTTYGSRLHGDPRGTVDRDHNAPGEPGLGLRPRLQRAETGLLRYRPFVIDADQRRCLSNAIVDTCRVRGWSLRALNVRTNHLHVVVSADHQVERIMNSLKAWSTRYLREADLVDADRPLWTRHGSTK